MKRVHVNSLFVLFFCITGLVNSGSAQNIKDFFGSTDKKTTWLGLDFSELRILGDAGADVWEIKDRYFESMNDLVLNETEKYNVAKTFRRSNISFDLSSVRKANAKVDVDKMKTYNSEDLQRVTPEQIQKMVSAYTLSDKTGYGIVFIVDGFNKTAQNASMYVTIIDMASQKVLLTKRMTGKAMGFGFRNYWARTIYEVLKSIDKSAYADWKTGAN